MIINYYILKVSIFVLLVRLHIRVFNTHTKSIGTLSKVYMYTVNETPPLRIQVLFKVSLKIKCQGSHVNLVKRTL